jgi:hypothetical protein
MTHNHLPPEAVISFSSIVISHQSPSSFTVKDIIGCEKTLILAHQSSLIVINHQ